jgi:hypothetical protein
MQPGFLACEGVPSLLLVTWLVYWLPGLACVAAWLVLARLLALLAISDIAQS